MALPAHDRVIRKLGLGSWKTPDSSRPGHRECVESQEKPLRGDSPFFTANSAP